jgi:DNA-binding XRE family transcriptional regulator
MVHRLTCLSFGLVQKIISQFGIFQNGIQHQGVPRSLHSLPYRRLRTLLAQARTEASLTQAQVAEKLKRPQSFVSKYESGERQLDVIEFLGVCRAIGIPPAQVMEQLL